MFKDNMINPTKRAIFSFGFIRSDFLQVLAWPLLCLMLAAGLWYWTLTKIDTEKRDVEKKALAEATALCKDYVQYLVQAIDRANQITLQLQYGWEQSSGNLNLQELSQGGLFRNPQINNVILVNREGRPVTATLGQLKNISFADREYFVYHKNDDSQALLIGRPLVSRTTGKPAIPFTRRLNSLQGAFDGVALVGFDPHYLTSFYAGSFPGKTGLLMTAGLDAVLRSATIGSAPQDTALRAVPLFNSAEGAAYLSGEQWFGDKQSRYVAWKTLQEYPLVAMVGLSEQEYFASHQEAWATDQRLAIAGSLILFMFALVAARMSTRIVRKKHQDEELRKAYRIATEGGSEGYYMYEALHDKSGSIADFVLVDCNECGAEFYGIAQPKLLQMKLSSLCPSVHFGEMMNTFRTAMASGFHENETKTPRESMLQIEWTKTRIVRSGSGLAVTVQDISERKRAEEELRLMNERFVLATSAGQVGVWDWDIPNNKLVWDDSMYHLYGLQRGDFGGAYEAWVSTIHPQDKAHTDDEVQAALRGERVYAPEFRIIRPDGSIRYIKADSQTFLDEDNKPLRMIGTNIDITERKSAQIELERYRDHLEHQKDLLQSVLENAPIRVFWKDTDLHYLGCNRLFAHDAGMGGPDDLIGKSDFDMGWRDQAALYQADDRVVMMSGVPKLDFEEPQTTPDGKTIWLSTSKVPLRGKDQRVIGILGIYADITQRKWEHAELERYRDHLEHLVQERTVELQEARVAAEAANRAKSVFLANMSHELRTPLNAILGFAELMEHDDNIPQAQKRNLSTINRSGRHLLTLINDILDISKIEAGRLSTQMQACDLHELIETIVEAMALRARQKGLELNVHVGDDVPRFISTDPGKLRQILINLLSNAVKFTLHGGIDLDVSTSDGGSQSTRLTMVVVVRDTGLGIANEELSRIFQPFYQTEHGIRSGEGTGLGLTIARQFAQLLGGELAAASVVDKGSAFTLRLPVDVADTMVVSPPHRRVVALAQGQASRRILVVEDKEDNQLLLTQLLQQVGLETRIAVNGKEALVAFETWQPHFIWMDMRMPVMDGYEATRRIRALPGGHEVKIVALTASAFREDRGAIIAAGCDEVLSKPLDEEQLFAAMERLLGLRYRYAEQSSPSAADPASGVDLGRLPADLRQELSRAAQILDEESTHRAIERVRETDARLASELEELVRTYRYDRIVTLCEQLQSSP